jgi:hypothetical protein
LGAQLIKEILTGGGWAGFEGLLAKPAAATAIPAAAHRATSTGIPSKDNPKVKGAAAIRAPTAAAQRPYVNTPPTAPLTAPRSSRSRPLISLRLVNTTCPLKEEIASVGPYRRFESVIKVNV